MYNSTYDIPKLEPGAAFFSGGPSSNKSSGTSAQISNKRDAIHIHALGLFYCFITYMATLLHT